MTKLVIFDLDGCLFDDRHRLPLIDESKTGEEKYHSYHSRLINDKVYPDVHGVAYNYIMKDIRTDVAFWTARPTQWIGPTARKLRDTFADDLSDHGECKRIEAAIDKLRMRRDGDLRPSSIIKAQWMAEELSIADHTSIDVYDDRKDVLDAYWEVWRAFSHDGWEFRTYLTTDGVISAYCPFVETKDEPVAFINLTPEQAGVVNDAIDNGFKAISLGYRIPEHMLKGETKPMETPEQQTAADILDAMAATFRERNAVYGDNAHKVEAVMQALFPDGVTLKNQGDYHMWHLFELIIVKLTRFSNSGLTHQDSIHDLAIYAAMCENLVNDHQIKTK